MGERITQFTECFFENPPSKLKFVKIFRHKTVEIEAAKNISTNPISEHYINEHYINKS